MDRPIIFSASMLKALLAGRKTQTRRVLTSVPDAPGMDVCEGAVARHAAPYLDAYCGAPCTPANPRGMSDRWCWWTRDDRAGRDFRVGYVPGDRLWVRESWRTTGDDGRADYLPPSKMQPHQVCYEAGGRAASEECVGKLRPSIFMPRWASRLTLAITDVRVQRLQEISEEDAAAEGAPDYAAFCEAVSPGERNTAGETAAETESRLRWKQRWFATLWDSLNRERAPWASNPWIVAVTFDVIRANIDAVPAGEGA